MKHIGLYVHIPFCARKCGYCDFYSIVPIGSQVDDLIDALLIELDRTLAACDYRVETVFVGGGTPSFLPEPFLARLAGHLRRIVEQHHPAEFSVEANPASLTRPKAVMLRNADANRISLGAQSFNAAELTLLERLHAPQDIAASVELVRRYGFEHLNLDLIFGIPGQTLESWEDSLRQAIALGPDHMACYGLTYETDTPLTRYRDRGEITPASDDLEAEMYQRAIDLLGQAGFEQYEISNFARPGGQCRHNLRYWHSQPGIGIGPAAASYLGGRRWRNVVSIDDYVRRIRSGESTVIDLEELPPLQRAGEEAMLRLRTIEGICRDEFHVQTGFDPGELFAGAIRQHVEGGLLMADDRRIALTRKGLLVADAVIRDFVLPDGG
jgi:oxygen-independent coproporphyrinogen III oxidase